MQIRFLKEFFQIAWRIEKIILPLQPNSLKVLAG